MHGSYVRFRSWAHVSESSLTDVYKYNYDTMFILDTNVSTANDTAQHSVKSPTP